MAVFLLADRLPQEWIAFIDNTAGEAALKKGYDKDAFVNAMRSVYWNTAARRGWRPVFARVESKANVADAVSRADLIRARHEGWLRADDNVDQVVVDLLTRAASNAEYAAHHAVDALYRLVEPEAA